MIVQHLLYYMWDRLFLIQLTVTLVVFFAIRVFQLVQYRRDRFSIFKLYGITGPPPSVWDGNFFTYAKHIRGKMATFLVEEEMHKKYGNFYGVFIGNEPSLIVTDLDILKKVFFEETKSFTERSVQFIQVPLNSSILFTKYPRWKAMRKYFSPLFSKYTMRGLSQTQFIEDSLRLMIDYIDQKVEAAKTAKERAVIDIIDVMKATALHLISTMAIRLPDVQVKENESNVKSLDKFMESSSEGVISFAIVCPLITPLIQFIANHFEHNAVLASVHRGLNKVVDEGIKRFKSQQQDAAPPAEEDKNLQMIDLMVKLHVQGKLSRKEVLSNAEAVLLAGYDTTSTTMTYICWALARHPEVQRKLRDELRAHGLESKYLTQVIKETMRRYPTVASFTTRLATETVTINGRVIPSGTKVVYNFWLISRDSSVWEDPERFDPERFRDGVEIHPCAFAPFGLGDRVCLGYQLAWLQLKMITCDLVLRYDMKLIAPQVLEQVSYAVNLTKPREKVLLEFQKV